MQSSYWVSEYFTLCAVGPVWTYAHDDDMSRSASAAAWRNFIALREQFAVPRLRRRRSPVRRRVSVWIRIRRVWIVARRVRARVCVRIWPVVRRRRIRPVRRRIHRSTAVFRHPAATADRVDRRLDEIVAIAVRANPRVAARRHRERKIERAVTARAYRYRLDQPPVDVDARMTHARPRNLSDHFDISRRRH